MCVGSPAGCLKQLELALLTTTLPTEVFVEELLRLASEEAEAVVMDCEAHTHLQIFAGICSSRNMDI